MSRPSRNIPVLTGPTCPPPSHGAFERLFAMAADTRGARISFPPTLFPFSSPPVPFASTPPIPQQPPAVSPVLAGPALALIPHDKLHCLAFPQH